ncbi:MAG: hypothetical protein CBD77_01515 [bacterium TMED217]|nr:MAG: hypothetical protein CBD77_01515 [bacterium TMED217]|tara:strand:+ start:5207 stop:5614 length:408 start_codon:yes stop_codon:yes gene_type:complete
MHDFENKIINLVQNESSGPDAASFILSFRGRQQKEILQTNRLYSSLNALAFILLVCVFTIGQLDHMQSDVEYFAEDINTQEYFDTDFNLIDQAYNLSDIETFTLFMLDESIIIDAEELVFYNELYENIIDDEVSL